jgi:rhamnose transport system ATP-binding protein
MTTPGAHAVGPPVDPGTEPAAPVLRVRRVSKSFGPVRAVSEVDLDLFPGEVVALAGENGSGKSTLANVIAGVFPPDEGSIEVAGRPAVFGQPRDALLAGIALVRQEPAAVPHLSLAENVLLPRLRRIVAVVDRRRLAAQARPYLERVGVHDDPTTTLATLPPGRRELVEVARALAMQPSVLILDEVTTRLSDPEQLFRVVEGELERGLAAVLITHRLREIRRLAHRAVVLRDGTRVAELARHDLTDERISAAMVGRELGAYFAKREIAPGRQVLHVDGVVTDRSPHPISLEVRAGEIVGVAGLVGSGRSELLETVAGARRLHRGTITVRGRRLPPGSTRVAAAAGIALVPEDRLAQALIPPHSVTQNLVLRHHRIVGVADARRERRQALDSVTRFRIRTGAVDAPVASLSGGNAQKVVLARCLAADPVLLLLDEPTRGVDVGARAEIYDLIGQLVDKGGAILMASSDLLELLGLCDRIIVLHDGEVAGVLDRDEAAEETVTLLASGGGRAVPDTTETADGARVPASPEGGTRDE